MTASGMFEVCIDCSNSWELPFFHPSCCQGLANAVTLHVRSMLTRPQMTRVLTCTRFLLEGEEPLPVYEGADGAAEGEDARCRDLQQPLLTAQVLRLLRAIIMGHCKVTPGTPLRSPVCSCSADLLNG